MKNMPKRHDNDLWENKKLGAEEQYVRKVSQEREQSVDSTLELHLISLRLQKNLIDGLKYLAREEGIGYQPLIRQILTHYVRDMFHTTSKRRIAHG